MAQTADTFQGRPCRHGHGGLRYVKSRCCVECQRTSTRGYRNRRGDAHTGYMREYTAAWYVKNPEAKLWHGAKDRAAEKDLEFSVSVSDISIPEVCPLLGIPLRRGEGRVSPNSPTLDRISNDKGYIPGNVWVISNAANTCKSGLDAERILQIGVRLRLKENSIVL